MASGEFYGNILNLRDWDQPANTVTGAAGVMQAGGLVADVRLEQLEQAHLTVGESFAHKYTVVGMDEPSPCVTGTRFGSGAPAVADVRIDGLQLGHEPMGNGKGAYWVQSMNDPSGTVTADPSHRKSGGASCIADVRIDNLPQHGANFAGSPGLMGVNDWNEPSKTVTGSASVTSSNAPAAIADQRLPYEPREGAMKVGEWQEPSGPVLGSAAVSSSNGTAAVADPRLNCEPRSGTYGVTGWDQTASAVIGHLDVHAGNAAIADPRLDREPRAGVLTVQDWDEPSKTVTGGKDPNGDMHSLADPRLMPVAAPMTIPNDNDRGVWVIESPWNCWHRPLTTLELAALQGFPTVLEDGSPLVLAGTSDRRWRERIGNAVPPPTMAAILGQAALSLLASDLQEMVPDIHQSGIWVEPETDEPAQLPA
jgi:hypothetical protein